MEDVKGFVMEPIEVLRFIDTFGNIRLFQVYYTQWE